MEMFYLIRPIILSAPVVTIVACSAQDPQMSAEEFQKPENHAAMEKTLAGCGLVLPHDPRAANCQNARNAKFALDTAEIARVRRAQALARESAEQAAGVNSVEKPQDLAPVQNGSLMSVEDFRKPENQGAMERTLAACGAVLAQDPRAANCRNARTAKLMLDTAEVARIRRAQDSAREGAGGASIVNEKSSGGAEKANGRAPASR